MAFTAKDVQALREKTGCGMMDCKKALVECDGDMDKAVDYLREKGLASQAKKADRVAAEGAVVTFCGNGVAAVVEANSETDFVGSNDEFKAFVTNVAKIAAEQNPADVPALLQCKNEAGATVEEMVQEIFLKFRENLSIRRFVRYEGITSAYVHAGNSIGVLVKFNTSDEIAAKPEFAAMGKAIAMQIAAQNPEYLSKADISDEELAKMKSFTIDSALNKPDSLPIPILNSLIEEVKELISQNDDIYFLAEFSGNNVAETYFYFGDTVYCLSSLQLGFEDFLLNFLADESKKKFYLTFRKRTLKV